MIAICRIIYESVNLDKRESSERDDSRFHFDAFKQQSPR